MDLFVINRYKDPSEQEDVVSQETINLQKLKQKIEERRKASSLKKQSYEITLRPTPEDSVADEETDKADENEEKKPVIIELAIPESATVAKVKKERPLTEFKVLGSKDFKSKIKVRRVLPYWLSHSISVPTNLQNLNCQVESLTWLHRNLKTTLLNEGITHLFPVQELVVPFILEHHKLPYPFCPHDVCVSAPTGSGKTLSFVLPVTQVLSKEIGNQIRALIVLPVQELATQVAKVFKKYASKVGLKVALLSGSVPLRQEQQQIIRHTETLGWISEVDIVVCTAGRLVEHLHNTEGFSLRHLQFLVIDEADRIMDHIQNDWLYHLDRHIKLENELMTGKIPALSWSSLKEQKLAPHKLLFSATLSQDPEKLEQWGLFQPKLFSVGPRTEFENEEHLEKYVTPDELKEKYLVCDAEEKPLVLYHLLVELKWKRVMCFTNSAQSAHRLSTLLQNWDQNEIKVAELSAALDRSTRESVLKKFQESEIDVLISTDALARGIDIKNCDYVISYDPPKNIKTYIHRAGRTGRAGREGCALTMLLPNQLEMFKETLKAGGKDNLEQIHINNEVLESLSEGYAVSINATKDVIQDEISSKVKKSIVLKRGIKNKKRKMKRIPNENLKKAKME